MLGVFIKIGANKLKKAIQNLILIICLCFFSFFCYKIYNYNEEEKEQEQLRDNLLKIAIINNTQETQKNNENKENQDVSKSKLPIEIDFEVLKNKNKDIIAWLYSEETPINYPVVQGKDNDYYLRRMLDGTHNEAGTIFVDYKNSSNFEDYNTIIYGHNMKNDTMFGTLINYKNQEYFNNHKEIYLFTENNNFKIKLFAGYITSSESDIYRFPKTSNTNEKLIKTAISKSTFKSEVEVSGEDKIITLSTCSYDFENARYVLLGVLSKIY